MKIYIVGHTSPDLDSFASAVGYSEFLTKEKRYEGSKIVPVGAGEPNAETKYIFKKFGVDIPELLDKIEVEKTDAFILVDHNEPSQRHTKVVDRQVLEIVDHHKLNASFTFPIKIDSKPLGSTSSLIFENFDMYGHKPSEKVSKLMLSAILSDTQGLKSSTTTGYDSEIAKKLAEDLEISTEKLTFEIFKAKSDITGLTPMEIAKKDLKILDFGGKKVFINQIETVEPEKILKQKDELLNALEKAKTQEGAGHGYIVVTDVLKVNSQIIYSNDEEKALIEKAFTTEGIDNVADIGPKISRKKDISPAIEAAMQN